MRFTEIANQMISRKFLGSLAAAAVLAVSIPAMAAHHDHGDSDAKDKAKDYSAKKSNLVETAISAGQFSTLATALTEAGLIETLSNEGPFTVFAPTDEAFKQLPEGALDSLLQDKEALKNVLLYHVVKGKVKAEDVVKIDEAKTVSGKKVDVNVKDGNVYVNKAKVVKTDIMASNGVIHVIDKVLLPPKADVIESSIVDVAVAAGDFTTLAKALKAADLAETLDTTEGPYTVFAPTDAAFAKLPEGTLASLLANKEQLKSILLYHVVSGEVTADQVVKLSSAETLAGKSVTINTQDGVKVNNANVLKTDIKADNGVIHVIDTVLVP